MAYRRFAVVEGWILNVLRHNDWKKQRPTVVLPSGLTFASHLTQDPRFSQGETRRSTRLSTVFAKTFISWRAQGSGEASCPARNLEAGQRFPTGRFEP
jgi:hypothetical protein